MNAYKLFSFEHDEELDVPGDEILTGVIIAETEDQAVEKAIALGHGDDLKGCHAFIELIGEVL